MPKAAKKATEKSDKEKLKETKKKDDGELKKEGRKRKIIEEKVEKEKEKREPSKYLKFMSAHREEVKRSHPEADQKQILCLLAAMVNLTLRNNSLRYNYRFKIEILHLLCHHFSLAAC